MEISPGRSFHDFGNDDDYHHTPMRQPRIKATTSNTASTSSPPKRLSGAAQEFVPKSRQVGNQSYDSATPPSVSPQPLLPLQTSSVQNRLLRIQHPAEYAAALNSTLNISTLTSSVQNRLNTQDKPDFNSNYLEPTEVENIALEYLATVINCLNDNPGMFDTVATRFLTIFDGMENNQFVLSNAMEDIFNESIVNPNFRYMGAKLYNLLHMLNLREDSLFHTLLQCKLEYHQEEVVKSMQSNSEQIVRETALFLAELYMQLRGDDSRIKLIAENIVFSLKQLLTKVSVDNIRCICLTLKLAGYDLDFDCPNDVNLIIQQLDAVNKATPGKYPLVQNVISLKRTNWGRTVSHDHTSSVLHASSSEASSLATTEPTLYGPDGKIITDEENQFLVTNLPNSPSTEEDEDFDPEVDLDPEMDEDTEKEYRKFCKLNK